MSNSPRRWPKVLLWTVIVLLLLVAVGPLLWPVPPLTDTVPAADLADPDSRFVAVNGLTVHYKEVGQGEPTLILLHGFGASLFTWHEVMDPLAQMGHRVIAFDRPAFGLTERPVEWNPADWTGGSPYSPDAQVDLVIGLMDELGIGQAILVGNSAGGTVSMMAALTRSERVQGLILLDPAVYAGGGAPSFVRPLLNTPQMQHIGPLIARRIQGWGLDFARSAWHDPAQITPETWAGYTKPLQADNWDRALWNLTAASRASGLAKNLDRFTLPVLVITGDDDRIVPTEQSVRLAGELPTAELVVIPACGHVPHEECPAPVLQAMATFLNASQ
ncbi:MAG: alpha/beta hydrolase [Caldilineaceae bacterium]|nr:alpha/beta hydrolase [Caldilineaceae bacterium]MBP8108460.1 alpha/beta hydrolase [Caldilineaceae bacterium]MBP8124606.1 alpha/beta hydrolase [Caldilineaceae bacterium]MBP9074368.1 alpha/beta hydrolase [Caldilineaceae bacterium]